MGEGHGCWEGGAGVEPRSLSHHMHLPSDQSGQKRKQQNEFRDFGKLRLFCSAPENKPKFKAQHGAVE